MRIVVSFFLNFPRVFFLSRAKIDRWTLSNIVLSPFFVTRLT